VHGYTTGEQSAEEEQKERSVHRYTTGEQSVEEERARSSLS